ncbi:MAG: hypothetical protein SGI77_20390 [Pirellulaceae bacterium]|nr:hypothetical protein [Pirellulaceae bacterium]
MLVRRSTIGFSLLWFVVGLAGIVSAANPTVSVISPMGLQRGTTTEIIMSGERLGDAHQVMFYTPGIEVSDIKALDDKKIKMTVTASKDADCDLHAFRVVTKTGLSNMRLLGVSPFPSIAEVEPNNDAQSPQTVAMNSTINGSVATEDVDYYVVELPQGQMITVEVEGLRLSHERNMFDPFVAILDDEGNELARSDDATLVQQDCICGVIAPAAGRYLIVIRDSSYGGSRDSYYRLHVGGFARPLALLPSGGRPGENLKATCIDFLGNTWQENFQLPKTASPRFKVWSSRGDLMAPSPNFLRVNDSEVVVESEPNDDYKSVPVIEHFPVALNGLLQTENDQDWFVFQATKGQALEFRLFARGMIRSPVDGVVEVHKFGGGRLVNSDDAGGPDSAFSFKAPDDGKYAICVKDHLGRGGPFHIYRLEISLPKPELVTTVKELERYISQTVPVHRGSRMAVLVQLDRRFITGDAKIVIPDLPPGVVHTEAIVSEKLNTVQLMLQADENAELVGKLVDLSARLKTPESLEIVGHMNQRTQLIRGQNNRDVWGVNSDKLAVAVLDQAEFDIEVVAPKVPLVRDGTMALVVKCKRQEGFTRPISLRVLDTPTGVTASTSVSIPEGKNEVEIPITANGKATLGPFPITVLATTKQSSNATVTVASKFVPLEVADSVFNFQFSKTLAEQGKSAKVLIGVSLKRPIEGKLEVELVGLPVGTTMKEAKKVVASDTKKLTYTLDVPANVRPGNFKTIVCRGTITSNKGVITQINGNGEVQIDAARAPVAGKPDAAATKKDVDQQLTRLEELRKEREEQK